MINSNLGLTEQDLRQVSTARLTGRLGQHAETQDGRLFRYGRAGAVALAQGKINIAAAVIADHANRTVAASQVIGDTSVSVNIGATAVTADQYAGGYLTVNDSTGEGISYLIASNDAGVLSTTVSVTLREPLAVALTISVSEVTLQYHPFDLAVVSAGAVAAQVLGVNNVTIPISNYGWFQVQGYCATLSDGVIAKGIGAITSDAVNGAVETEVAGTTSQRVGFAPEATVDTEYRVVNLTLQ